MIDNPNSLSITYQLAFLLIVDNNFLSIGYPSTTTHLEGKPVLVPDLVPGSRTGKTLDPWDRPGTRTNPSNLFSSTQLFCCHSVLSPLVTLCVSVSFLKIFVQGKKNLFGNTLPGFTRGNGDGECKRVPLDCPKL